MKNEVSLHGWVGLLAVGVILIGSCKGPSQDEAGPTLENPASPGEAAPPENAAPTEDRILRLLSAAELVIDEDAELQLYDEVLALDPDHEAGLERRAELLYLLDRNDEAIVDLDRRVALESVSPKILRLRADVLAELGAWE